MMSVALVFSKERVLVDGGLPLCLPLCPNFLLEEGHVILIGVQTKALILTTSLKTLSPNMAWSLIFKPMNQRQKIQFSPLHPLSKYKLLPWSNLLVRLSFAISPKYLLFYIVIHIYPFGSHKCPGWSVYYIDTLSLRKYSWFCPVFPSVAKAHPGTSDIILS